MKNFILGGVFVLLSACGGSSPVAPIPNPQKNVAFAESIESAEIHVSGKRIAFSMRRTGQAELNDALFVIGPTGLLSLEGAHMKGLVFSGECMDAKCEAFRMVLLPDDTKCLDATDCLDAAVLELRVFRSAQCSISSSSSRTGESANSMFRAEEVTMVENRTTGRRAMKVVVALRDRTTPNEVESFLAESTLGSPGELKYAANYYLRKADGTLERMAGGEGTVPLLQTTSWDAEGRRLTTTGQSKDRRVLASVSCSYGLLFR